MSIGRRRAFVTVGLIVIAFSILIGYRHLAASPEASEQAPAEALIDQDLPTTAVVIPLRGGEPRPLSDEIVGATVINFFASWCAPCHAENPTLLQLRAEGVRVVGVAVRDEPAATQTFLDELGDPYFRVMTDPQGEAMQALRLGSDLPQTLVVSSDGRVLMRHSGALLGTDGQDALEEIRDLAGPH